MIKSISPLGPLAMRLLIVGLCVIQTFTIIYISKIFSKLDSTATKVDLILSIDNAKPTSDIEKNISKLKPNLDKQVVKLISESILKYSTKFKLPPNLIIAIINRESKFEITARNKSGAEGLMQIMTKVHQNKIKKLGITSKEVFYIDNNIHLGCWILREYYNKSKSMYLALKRYVGGEHPEYIKNIFTTYINFDMQGEVK